MKVLASPLVPNSPLTPKSQSRTWPERVRRILDGLISGGFQRSLRVSNFGIFTSVDDLSAV